MKLTIALALLLPPATGVQNAGRRGLRHISSNDETDDIESDRYWIVPVKDVGLTSVDVALGDSIGVAVA